MTQAKLPIAHALIAAALALPLGAMAAEAGTQAPAATKPAASPVEDAFKMADTNRDAALSKDEAKIFPAIASQFNELDRNADGALNYEEFQNGLKPAAAK